MPRVSKLVIGKNEKEIRKAINGAECIWQIRGCPGLRLAVLGDKRARWRYRYVSPVDGGRKWHTRDGFADPEKFMEAIAWADGLTNDLSNGHKPQTTAEKEAVALAEKMAADRNSFDWLVREWIERHGKVNKRSWANDLANYENHLKTEIGAVGADKLTRAQITAVLNKITDKGSGHQANRIGALISACYSWAVDEGLVAEHPAYRLRKRVKERKSERWLKDDEIARLWKGLDGIPQYIADAIRLLAMLGRRRNEVAGMHLKEIDLKRCEWNVPSERVKGRKDHTRKVIVPLSKHALAVIKRQEDNDGFVFPARMRHPQAIEHSTLSARFADIAKELVLDPPGTPRYQKATLHTLRHTVKTHMQALQVPSNVSDAITGHGKQERERGAASIYEHHAFEREMVYALRLWHLRLLDIVKGRNRALFWSWTPAKEHRRQRNLKDRAKASPEMA